MTVARKALSVLLLGAGVAGLVDLAMAVWWFGAWLLTMAGLATLTYSVLGAFAYHDRARVRRSTPDWERWLAARPWACGPLVWLWLLTVAPWLDDDEEAPRGF